MPQEEPRQPKPRVSAREKTRRDDEIVKARMRGMGWATIAANHNLSVRQCQAVMAEYRGSHPTPRSRDPLELLDELLERYEGAQEELAEIAASTTHDATRVGAVRTRLDAMTAEATLLQTVGVLPRDLGKLRFDIDARELARKTLAVFNEYGVSYEARRALLSVLDGRNGHP